MYTKYLFDNDFSTIPVLMIYYLNKKKYLSECTVHVLPFQLIFWNKIKCKN